MEVLKNNQNLLAKLTLQREYNKHSAYGIYNQDEQKNVCDKKKEQYLLQNIIEKPVIILLSAPSPT